MTRFDDFRGAGLGSETQVLVPILVVSKRVKSLKFLRKIERLTDFGEQSTDIVGVDPAGDDTTCDFATAFLERHSQRLDLARQKNAL